MKTRGYSKSKVVDFIPMDELIINNCEVLQMARSTSGELPTIKNGKCTGYRYDDGEKVMPCSTCNICSKTE